MQCRTSICFISFTLLLCVNSFTTHFSWPSNGLLKLLARRPRVPTSADSTWQVRPVGVVESPYLFKHDAPRQATIGEKQDGRIVLYPGFEECLSALEGFDYVWVLSLLHLNRGFKTKIRPQPNAAVQSGPLSPVGLFASRAPHRPNPLGLSAVRVLSVDASAGVLQVQGLDLLHDTPVLDIKPYIPAFDAFPQARAGWMDRIRADPQQARREGYQSIQSPRGRRAARAEARSRLLETGKELGGEVPVS